MATTETADPGSTNPGVTVDALLERAFQTNPQEVSENEDVSANVEAPESAETPTEPETAEPEANAEESQESEAEPEGDEFVLSQDYIDSLDDDTKRQLAEWVGSGLGKDMGKLRSEKRDLQEQLDALKEKYEDSLQSFVPKSDNPFSNITDEKELTKTESQINEAIDYWRKFEREGNWETNERGDDGVYQNNQWYPKDSVLTSIDNWIKQLPKIVEQRYRLREIGSIGNVEKTELDKAKSELSWLSDESSEQYKEYSKMLKDRDVQMIADISPKLGAKLKRYLAHSVNSMNSPKPTDIRLPKRGKPAKLGDGATGTASMDREPEGRRAREAKKRVESGKFTDNDVVAAFIESSFT